MSTTTPTPSAEATQPRLSPSAGRRTVLRAVGLVALGGGTTAILAACGADTSTSSAVERRRPSDADVAARD